MTRLHTFWIGFLFFLGLMSSFGVQAQPTLLNSTSININGEVWTFKTPPPPESQRQVIASHPRLFLTQANLPGIRQKLSDPVYADDMVELRSIADDQDPTAQAPIANAFLYLLEGDISRGNAAKNWLLSGSFGDVGGFDKAAEWVEPILVFDWVYPLLSSAEKTTAFNNLKSNFGYNHRTASPRDASRYWNDVWARHQELHYPILALAIAGDGIDDTWAQEVLDLVYNESPLVMGPYGPNRGSGFLDMLASISLDDGGGSQVGSYEKLGDGYYSMYLHAILPMAAWETATGQAMWSRSDYFRKLPVYWAYLKNRTPTNIGSAMPEILTGVYKNIDPDAAALARWQVNQFGRYKRILVYRLILGDLRITPKSPLELGLPVSKYLRGGDVFVSSRSWEENAVTLTAYSRYLDSARFEPGSGLFAIYKGDEPLAVGAEPNKTRVDNGYYSGLWIYESGDAKGTRGQESTYWGLGPSRAFDAYTAASDPGYFTGGPDNIVINDTYRGISTEYAKLLKAPGVITARQSIVHIMDTDRDFVVVYNYTDIPDNLRRAWSMRLAVDPNINGNSYSIPGMNTTIVAPLNHSFDWVGGVNDEFKTPSPENEWYGNNRSGNVAGFASDPSKAKANGIGNLFVKPNDDTPDQLEFLVVIDVSTQTPVQVTRISDREVVFGNWRVVFTKDGDFTVTTVDGCCINLIFADDFE
ncbi:MAG: hypothetical protein L3J24_11215 [Xanthomonadales bacterium]|nr:hypothetical protein [Xanthomonadales bacterium]